MGITWDELDGIKALYTRLAPNSIPSPPPSPPPPPPPPPQSSIPMTSWAAWTAPPQRPPTPVPKPAKFKLKLPGLVISGNGAGGGGGGSGVDDDNDDGSRNRFAPCEKSGGGGGGGSYTRQGSHRLWEFCEKPKNVFDSLTERERMACFNNDAYSTQTGNFMFVPITSGGEQKTTIRLQYLFDKK